MTATLARADRPRRLRRWLGIAGVAIVGAAAAIVAGGYAFLRASLPTLDGRVGAPGLVAAATIERDAAGVPTIRAASEGDLAYAMGYAHAQDRFFQMDLLRRAASGELAALLGPTLTGVDRERRIHRFAFRAGRALQALSPAERELLERYARGVNAGLASLAARPFEYAVLQSVPRPWRSEDTLLVIWAMYFDLQDDQLHRVFSRGFLRDHGTTPEQLAFLLPTATAYDAPLDAARIDEAAAPIPAAAPSWFGRPAAPRVAAAKPTTVATAIVRDLASMPDDAIFGSNDAAIAGRRTASGAGIVSDDMHLALRLPNIWYRAALEIRSAGGDTLRSVGVTLPGAPALVVGSNGRVAWGYTNSYGHLLDLVELEFDPNDPTRYRRGDGWARLSYADERIDVRGGASETLRVAESELGPLWERDGHRYAVRWIADDPAAVDLVLRELMTARDVDSALAIGQRAGVPAQNMVAADVAGHIGWTIAGPLPDRQATFAETFPYRYAFAAESPGAAAPWSRIAPPATHPRLVDPASGQLSTANSRQLAGADHVRIGDGGADLGARATQLRDDLAALGPRTDVAAVFGVALDDRARYLEPWRQRALRALAGSEGDPAHPRRAEWARLLATGWSGQASVDSVAYRLVRGYPYALYRRCFASIDDAMRRVDKGASFARATQRWPAVVARLLDEQPAGWLPPGSRSWHEVELAALDDAAAELDAEQASPEAATWGRRNTARIAHPLAGALPFGRSWLAAPADALPGDNHMPRVAAPDFGQSERLVVSPGHEAEGLFDMPGGASGHPLSAFFLAGHEAWVRGRPTPLLPGTTAHTLTLEPS